MTVELNRDTSDVFRIARVVCILFMLTVHVWPGAELVVANAQPTFFYQIVIGYFGRSSVPLLGIISGFLFWYMQSKREIEMYRIIARKAQSLLLPMILWSSILLLVFVLYFFLTGDNRGLPTDWMGWVNSLFAITSPPFNTPLGFLRDVFVSVVVGVGIWKMHFRWPSFSIVGLLLIVIIVLAFDSILFLRPTIFAFFALGMLIAWMGWLPRIPGWGWGVVLLALDLAVRELLATPTEYYAVLGKNLFHRLTVALLMWNLCTLVVRRARGLAEMIKWLEPYIFFIFCSHMVTIAFMSYFARKAGLDVSQPGYLVFFILQLLIIILSALCAHWVMARISPRPLQLLSGGRG